MASRTRPLRLVLALLVASSGCAVDAGIPAGESARTVLDESALLPIAEEGTVLHMVARVNGESEPTPIEVHIDEGWIAAHVDGDGTLVVDAFEVSVDDLVLGESGGSLAGLHLADVGASLSAPVRVETEWLAGDHGVIGTAPIEVELTWSMVTERGDVLPMAPQRIDQIDLSVHAYMSSDGELSIELSAARPGVFWQWARTVELSDLDLEAVASEG